MTQLSLFPESTGAGAQVPHPIPYQGSKRHLAPQILAQLPGRIRRLVEPFAGSAAISLAAAHRGMADTFWLNDAHAPLMALWHGVLNRPDKLSDRYAELWNAQLGRERPFYDEVRAAFNSAHRPEHFLYLLARCVKAAVRYNAQGEFNNSPDNRRKGARPAAMRARLAGASRLLRGRSRLTSGDYLAVLKECRPVDVVYLDPPYQGVCGDRDSRYCPRVDHDAFCDALAGLNRREVPFLVSYDGRTGDKVFGKALPASLRLVRVELHAGRSSQATLLGRAAETYESLYLSAALVAAGGSKR